MRTIECADMGIVSADEKPRRTYELNADWDASARVYTDAFVWEIDRDGGVIRGYPLSMAEREVYERGLEMIRAAVREWKAAA